MPEHSPRGARRGRPAARGMQPQYQARGFALGPAARQRPRRRVPWRRIMVTIGSLAMLGGIAYGLAWLLLGDSLRVQEIHVAGTEIADPVLVAAAAAIDQRSLLTIDTAQAAERITSLPEIKSATVTRRWPQGIAISVVEHQAWGYWQSAGRRVEIDVDGYVLTRARPAAANAPTIIEIGGRSEFVNDRVPDPDSVHLVAQLTADGTFDQLNVRPSGFVFRPDRGLTVLVDDGPDIVFGDSSNYGFKVATWAALVREIAQDARSPREIDLRFGRQVVMR